MKFKAKPVIVDAFEIVSVAAVHNTDGSLNVALSNGKNEIAMRGMMARMIPREGDYWVVQPDGYIYLNPKDIFQKKYESTDEI